MLRYDLAKKKKGEQGLLEAYIIADLNEKLRRERDKEHVLQKEMFDENRCDEPHKKEPSQVIIIEF